MSTTVDQKVVEMRFDNSRFQKNISATIQSLDKFKEKLNFTGATKGIKEIDKAAKSVDMSTLSKSADTIKMKFSAMEVVAMTALANITNSAMNTGKRMISALTIDPVTTGFSEYETKMNSIKTILANTSASGTSLEDVNEALAELNSYSDKTIYNFAQMTDMVGKFAATSGDLDSSVSIVKGMANLAAFSGVENTRLQSALYQTSQAMSGSYFQAIDWMSLENSGLATKKFRDDLIETAMAMGTLTEAQKAMMDRGDTTFAHSLSDFKWLTTDVFAAVTDTYALDEAMTEAAGSITTFTKLFDVLKETAQSGWAVTWETIVGDAETSKKLFSQLNGFIGKLITTASDSRNSLLKTWSALGGRTELIRALGYALLGLTNILEPIHDAFRDLFPPITAKGLYDITVGFRNLMKSLVLNEDGMSKLYAIAKGVFSVFDLGGKIIKSVVMVGFTLLATIVSSLNIDLLGIAASIGKFVTHLSNSVHPITNLGEAANFVRASLVGVATFVRNLIAKLPAFNGQVARINTTMATTGKTTDQTRKKVVASAASIGRSFDGASEKFDNFAGGCKNAFNAFTTTVSNMFAAVGAFTQRYFGSALATGLGIALIVLSIKLLNSFAHITAITGNFCKDIVSSLVGLVRHVDQLLSALGGVLNAQSRKLKSEAFLNNAKAILILVGAIGVLTLLDPVEVAASASAVATLMAAMIVYSWAVSKVTDIGSTAVMAANVVAFAIGVKALVDALDVATGIGDERLLESYRIIGILGVGLATLSAIMATYAPKMTGGVLSMVAFSFAIGHLVKSMDALNDLDIKWNQELIDDLIKAGAAFGGLMIALRIGGKYATQIGFGMLAMVVAVKMLLSSLAMLSDIKNIPTEDIIHVVIAVGVVFGVLALFSEIAEHAKKIGVMLIMTAGSITILLHAIALFADINDGTLERGLTAITTVGLIFIVLSAVSENAKHAIKAGAMFLMATVSIYMLIGAILMLGIIPNDILGKGLVAVSVIMVMFSVLVKSTKLAKSAFRSIMAISIAVSAMVVMLGVLSFIKLTDLIAPVIALGVVMWALSNVFKSTANLASQTKQLVGIVGSVGAIAILVGAIGLLSTLPAEGVLAAGVAIAVTIVALSQSLKLMGGTVDSSAALITASTACIVLAGALNMLGNLPGGGLLAAGVALAVTIGALAASLHFMAGTMVGSVALVTASAAVLVLGAALLMLMSLPGGNPITAGIGLAVTIAALAASLGLMTGTIAGAAALIVGSTACIVLAGALKMLAKLPGGGVLASGIALSITLLALAGALYLMSGTIVGSAALIIASTALIILSTALLIVSNLNMGQVITGFIALAGALLILGLAAIGATAIAPALIVLTLALAGIGVGLAVLGAGLTAIGIGMRSIGIGMTYMVAGLSSTAEFVGSIVSKIIAILKDADIVKAAIDIGKNILGGVINGLKNGLSGLWNAAKSLGQMVIDGFKGMMKINSPSKIMEWLGEFVGQGAIDGIANTFSDLYESGKNAATNVLDGFTDKMSEGVENKIATLVPDFPVDVMPNTVNSTGEVKWPTLEAEKRRRELAERLGYGDIPSLIDVSPPSVLLKMKPEATNDFKSTMFDLRNISFDMINGGVSDPFKDLNTAFDPAMIDQMTMSTDGLTGSTEGLTTAVQELDAAYQHSMDWIENEKYYDRLTPVQELAAYTRVQQRYAKGSEERKKADREVYRLQKELHQKYKDYQQKELDIKKAHDDEKLELDEEYAENKLEIEEKLQDDIVALEDDYADALEDRTKSIYDSYNLFDHAKMGKKVSGAALVNNLRSQVEALDEWKDSLSNLRNRGVSNELVDELESMGPSALKEIRALTTLSDAELDNYADMWGEKHEFARIQAESELSDMRADTNRQIKGLREDADTELTELTRVWTENINTLDQNTQTELQELATNFKTEIGVISTDTTAEFNTMVKEVDLLMTEAGWDKMGQQVAAGFAQGLKDSTYLVTDAATEMANAAPEAAMVALDIHSPSRVAKRIGGFFGQGFVDAIHGYAQKADTAGRSLADSAKNSLNKTIANISQYLSDDFDTNPTIRPVVDLTDVKAGAGYASTLFNGIGGTRMGGTIELAQSTANGINRNRGVGGTFATPEPSRTTTNAIDNKFYITGDNPREIATQVSRILQNQYERMDEVWA